MHTYIVQTQSQQRTFRALALNAAVLGSPHSMLLRNGPQQFSTTQSHYNGLGSRILHSSVAYRQVRATRRVEHVSSTLNPASTCAQAGRTITRFLLRSGLDFLPI